MNQFSDNLSEYSHKLLWVQGLVIGCPLGKPLENCIANDYRLMPINDRLKEVQAMEENQLDAIIRQHKQCMRDRGF